MMFVADEIPQQLRRIVEFLNEQMGLAEVLALELRQYISKEGQRTLVPRIIGQTAEAEIKKGTSRGEAWTKERFWEEILQRTTNNEVVDVAKRILAWAEAKMTRVKWGSGGQTGTFTPILEHKGVAFRPFVVWPTWVQMFSSDKHPFDSDEKRRELTDRLNRFLDDDKRLSTDAPNRFTSCRLSSLIDSTAWKNFESAFDWFVNEVKSS